MREITVRKKEDLQEAGIAALILIVFIKDLIMFLIMAAQIYLFSKEAKLWSNRLTKLLSEEPKFKGKWKVWVVDFPGDSEMVNAFSLGIGSKHVFITKPLMKMLTDREVMAVLLHEAAHSVGLHMIQQTAGNYAFLSICVKLFIEYGYGVYMAVPTFLSYIMIVLAFGLAPQVLTARTLGRWHERIGDSYAVKHGYGKELISGLRKMTKHMMKDCTSKFCKKMIEILHAIDAHPPLKQRVKEIMTEIAKIRAGAKVKATQITAIVKKAFKSMMPKEEN
ncbi:MAG: M48 family metalloprotease [Candidatus Heimdallarchaeaceae archaeon]